MNGYVAVPVDGGAEDTAAVLPKRCPVRDFVLFITSLRACRPNAVFTACVSVLSFMTVDVP